MAVNVVAEYVVVKELGFEVVVPRRGEKRYEMGYGLCRYQQLGDKRQGEGLRIGYQGIRRWVYSDKSFRIAKVYEVSKYPNVEASEKVESQTESSLTCQTI